MLVRLEVSHNKANVKRVVLRRDAVIGRGKECNLRIASNLVSRQHCRIVLGGERVFVRDLGSSNGTYLAGTRLPREQDVLLPPGAELSIGGVTFVVQYDLPDGVPGGSTVEIALPPKAGRETPPVARAARSPAAPHAGSSGKDAAAEVPEAGDAGDDDEPVFELIDAPAAAPEVVIDDDAPEVVFDDDAPIPEEVAGASEDPESLPVEPKPGLLGRLFGFVGKRRPTAARPADDVADADVPDVEVPAAEEPTFDGADANEETLPQFGDAEAASKDAPPPAADDADLGDFLRHLGKD
ncbi:MAG: FHA domain-containing protein [Planctomycetaceae bacterium]